MPTIQSLGIGSGLDIDSIVTALVDAEKVPQETKLENEQTEINTKISELGIVKSNLSDLQSKINALKSTSNFDTFTASSTDTSVLTATTSTLASAGTYSVKVDQTALGHTLATTAFSNINDTIGTGTITIAYGTTDYTGPDPGPEVYTSFTANSSQANDVITVDSNNNTLSSLRDYINAGDYDVSASIVNDGNGYRLLLNANTGVKNSMQITVDDDDTTDTDTSGLSVLAFNGSATNAEQTQAGQDASITVNGLNITRESNSVSEVISGVTLNLQNSNTSTQTITIARDTSSIEEQVTDVVESYNTFKTHLNEITEYNATTGAAGALLGDATIRAIDSQIRNTLFSGVSGLTGEVRAVADLGILSAQSDGLLSVDSSELSDAINNNIEDVRALFAPTATTTDSLVQYISSSSNSVAGTYSLYVSQMATRGTFTGTTINDLDIQAAKDNDNFVVRVDGILSSTITLTEKVYTDGDELAAEVQSQINKDSNLQANYLSVAVTCDSTNNRLDIQSGVYGSTSKVAITSVDTAVANAIGLSESAGTDGLDVAGSFDATRGIITGSSRLPNFSGGGSIDISAANNNDNFAISVDGITSGTITLTANTYTSGDDLATEIQTQINADATLSGSGKTVTVKYDGNNNRFTIESDTFGSTSTVALTAVATSLNTDLGLTTGAGVTGVDGDSAIGAGQFLVSSSGNSQGLKVGVLSGNTGDRGNVTFSRGVADQLSTLIDNYLDSDGLLDSKEESLESSLDRVAQDQANLTFRMDKFEARILAQFTAMEALVNQLNGVNSFLTSALASLPGAKSSGG